jgi:hypothetical protein
MMEEENSQDHMPPPRLCASLTIINKLQLLRRYCNVLESPCLGNTLIALDKPKHQSTLTQSRKNAT